MNTISAIKSVIFGAYNLMLLGTCLFVDFAINIIGARSGLRIFENLSVEKRNAFDCAELSTTDTYREKVSDSMLRLGEVLITVDGIENFKLRTNLASSGC